MKKFSNIGVKDLVLIVFIFGYTVATFSEVKPTLDVIEKYVNSTADEKVSFIDLVEMDEQLDLLCENSASKRLKPILINSKQHFIILTITLFVWLPPKIQ